MFVAFLENLNFNFWFDKEESYEFRTLSCFYTLFPKILLIFVGLKKRFIIM